MARTAMARETICALRREIARIEGTLPEPLAMPGGQGSDVLRHGGMAARRAAAAGVLETGVARFDAALGGGVPLAALIEIHGRQTRDAGAAAGFALALAALVRKEESGRRRPLLWIGGRDLFREAGNPYAPGLERLFGVEADAFLFCAARHLADALWAAEEAARVDELCAVILEVRGNPARLDLTATRRLHRRAQEAGRPVLLLREWALAEPTAAPLRLEVGAAPAAPRAALAAPLEGTIGHPAFAVAIGKSRAGLQESFVVEWNPDALSLREVRPARARAVVPASGHRPHPAQAGGAVVALRRASVPSTPGGQPPREGRSAHRRPRRTG